MAGVQGYLHKLQLSSAVQDTSTFETTVDLGLNLTQGLQIPTVSTRFYDMKTESHRTTSLPESVGPPISVEGSYPIGGGAWSDALAIVSYWAAHPGASHASTIIGAGPGYRSEWDWPGTPGVFRGLSMEALGLEGTSDDNQNRDFHNAIMERLSVIGSRDNEISWNGDCRFGGVVEAGGTGTSSVTVDYTRLFTMGMAHCHYSTTAGFAASPTHPWTDAMVMATNSDLAGTPVDLSSYLQSFNVTFTRRPDVPTSKAPGNVTAGGAGVIPTSDDWLEDTNGPDATIEMVFTSPKTSEEANIAAFPSDMEAGTVRGFEIWIEENTSSITGGFLGWKATFGRIKIEEAGEIERGGGTKHLRVVGRPIFDSTETMGAHLSMSHQLNTTFGDDA